MSRRSILHATRRAERTHGKPVDPTPLLLASGLSLSDVTRFLAPYGFRDTKRADANLQAMAGEPRARQRMAAVLVKLLRAVAQTADPDQALNHWEQFLRDGINRIQLFDYLDQAPRILHQVCTIFGNSPALAQTLIRNPLLIYWLAEEQVLTRRAARTALDRALRAMLQNVESFDLKLDALRRFRRREMLRIGVRDLLRLSDVRQTTVALSDLACVLIQVAYEMVSAALCRRYGTPMHSDEGGQLVETGFAVIGMGKLGGGELNFSSDVDLVYVYATDEGATMPSNRQLASSGRPADGRKPRFTIRNVASIPNEEYFEYLARDLTSALGEVTQEGYVFRVDLRLRAEGSVGRLARPLAGYLQYYRTRGQHWERLALIKAWPVAGDLSVGRAFLRIVRPFLFDAVPTGGERRLFEEVRGVKEMIDGKIATRGETNRNVKLGIGGIREIEFLLQAIQVGYGGRLVGIRHRNTLAALERFHRHGILTKEETECLVKAYCFLRDVEHKLQMVHDLQTHALPEAFEETVQCAIRLGYAGQDRKAAASRLLADYRRHTNNVHRLFKSLFYARRSTLLNAVRRVATGAKRQKRPGGIAAARPRIVR